MQIIPAAVPAVVTEAVFTTLAFVIVSLRLFTRAVMVRNVGADDYLMAGSLCASIVFFVVVMLQIKYGLGQQVPPAGLPSFLEALWATIPVYNLSLLLSKLSIATQCARVFRTPTVQRVLRCFILLFVVYGLWTVFGSFFVCVPVRGYWDGGAEDGSASCMNRSAVTFSNAGINIVSDICLLAVPLPLLRRLQIPKRQKVILMAVFACGAFACITSIIRLKALYTIGNAPQPEQSVQGVQIAVWSCIEINMAIICGSVPALKPLAVKVFPRALLSDLYARSKPVQLDGGEAGSASASASRRHAGGGQKKQQDQQLKKTQRTVVGGDGDSMNSDDSSGSSDHHQQNRTKRGISSKDVVHVQRDLEIEMHTVAAAGDAHDDDYNDHDVHRPGDEDKTSHDGSEKELVHPSSSWRTDCYASPDKDVHPLQRSREMV